MFCLLTFRIQIISADTNCLSLVLSAVSSVNSPVPLWRIRDVYLDPASSPSLGVCSKELRPGSGGTTRSLENWADILLCLWHPEEGSPLHSCIAWKGQWCRCPWGACWWCSGNRLHHWLSRLSSIPKEQPCNKTDSKALSCVPALARVSCLCVPRGSVWPIAHLFLLENSVLNLSVIERSRTNSVFKSRYQELQKSEPLVWRKWLKNFQFSVGLLSTSATRKQWTYKPVRFFLPERPIYTTARYTPRRRTSPRIFPRKWFQRARRA